MMPSIQRNVNLRTTPSQPPIALQPISKNQHFAWLKNSFNKGYNGLLPLIEIVKRNCLNAFSAVKNQAWTHKKWVAGGIVLAAALVMIHRLIKSMPQYPVVELKTTLNQGVLSIQVPKEKHNPPNVTLTFCIDMSGSMNNDERGGAVKKALNGVLKNAQKIVCDLPGTHIAIAITGFKENATLITPITKLTSDEKKSSAIQSQISSLNFNGSTNILNGLELAVQEVEKASNANRLTNHFLLLLSDGEDEEQMKRLPSLQQRLKTISAKLFAIGIGKEHNKKTLKAIASKGTYIDTAAGQHTIESAVAEIYKQAISSFSSFQLTTEQLKPEEWIVLKTDHVKGQKQLTYDLGSLSEGKTFTKIIKICDDKLDAPLDLSFVKFKLTFVDPKGKKGEMELPWNPNTIIDPTILKVTA